MQGFFCNGIAIMANSLGSACTPKGWFGGASVCFLTSGGLGGPAGTRSATLTILSDCLEEMFEKMHLNAMFRTEQSLALSLSAWSKKSTRNSFTFFASKIALGENPGLPV